jgi:hypothetical protein
MATDVLTRAYQLIEDEQHAAARQLLQPLVTTQPNNADAWWLLAHAVDDPPSARVALQNVLRIDPNYSGAQMLLATLEQTYPAAMLTQPPAALPLESPASAPAPVRPLGMPSANLAANAEPDFLQRADFAAPVSATPVATPPAPRRDDDDDDFFNNPIFGDDDASEPARAADDRDAFAPFDDDEDNDATDNTAEDERERRGVNPLFLGLIAIIVIAGIVALLAWLANQNIAVVDVTQTSVAVVGTPSDNATPLPDSADIELTTTAIALNVTPLIDSADIELTTTAIALTFGPTPDAPTLDANAQTVDLATPTEEPAIPTTGDAPTLPPLGVVELTLPVPSGDATTSASPIDTAIPLATDALPTAIPLATDALPTAVPPTDAPPATAVPPTDAPALGNADVLQQAFSSFTLSQADTQPPVTSETTTLGQTTVVNVCGSFNDRAMLTQAMTTLGTASSTLPDTTDALGLRFLDCATNSGARTIAIPLATAQQFAQGTLDQASFFRAWQPVG